MITFNDGSSTMTVGELRVAIAGLADNDVVVVESANLEVYDDGQVEGSIDERDDLDLHGVSHFYNANETPMHCNGISLAIARNRSLISAKVLNESSGG